MEALMGSFGRFGFLKRKDGVSKTYSIISGLLAPTLWRSPSSATAIWREREEGSATTNI